MKILHKKNIVACSLLILIFGTYFVHAFYAQNSIEIDRDKVIEKVMAYQMPDIIERCKKDFDYTDEDMQILEKEFKRFLILCILRPDSDPGVGMYSKDVDNLWHTFILFTKEYAAFCMRYNNSFIHHVPTLDKDRTPEKLKNSGKKFQKFINMYETTFNEEIHPIWFLDRCENQ